MISRQLKYQRKHQELGLCNICSDKVVKNHRRCIKHLVANRKQKRKKLGCNKRYVGVSEYQPFCKSKK